MLKTTKHFCNIYWEGSDTFMGNVWNLTDESDNENVFNPIWINWPLSINCRVLLFNAIPSNCIIYSVVQDGSYVFIFSHCLKKCT